MEETKVKPGDVLWSMKGIRQNGKIRWYAAPMCVESVDKHKFLDMWGHGASHNSIGSHYFLSREDAIKDFADRGHLLEEDIDPNEPLSKALADMGVKEKPRTEWGTYKVVRFDGVTNTSIYVNGFHHLLNVTEVMDWKSRYADYAGEIFEMATLDEIYKCFSTDNHHIMITVFENGPMRCNIFQCGNYGTGKWAKLGTVMGYA